MRRSGIDRTLFPSELVYSPAIVLDEYSYTLSFDFQVKWMMYWIVFALFTCAETFTDVFFSFW